MSGPDTIERASSQEPFKLPEVEGKGFSSTIKGVKLVHTAESVGVSERNAQTRSFLGNVIHNLGASFKTIWNFISARIRTIRNTGSNFLVLIGVRSTERGEVTAVLADDQSESVLSGTPENSVIFEEKNSSESEKSTNESSILSGENSPVGITSEARASGQIKESATTQKSPTPQLYKQLQKPSVIKVQKIIEALKEKEVFSIEGTFRISGLKKNVNGYLKKLRKKKGVSFKEGESIHTIAGVLKGYIKSLKILENLPEVRGKFLKAGNKEESDAVRIQLLKGVLGSISDEHREVLKSLVTLCKEIAINESVTKMSSENLATCLVPNIIGEGDINNALNEAYPSIAAFKFLIDHENKIFMATAD